jgi:hypothetical protein
VFELAAIPLRDGELWPALVIRYKIGSQSHSQLAIAERSVQVHAVDRLVECSMAPSQPVARQNHPLPLHFAITNHTPFTLTHVSLSGRGTDLEWPTARAIPDLLPGQTLDVGLTPTVRGKQPEGKLALAYQWIDDTNETLSGITSFQSSPILLGKSRWSQVPASAVTGLLGALVGALAGLIPWAIRERHGRRQGERLNRERVVGMLELITSQTQAGDEASLDVSREMSDLLFTEKGLYAALSHLGKALARRNAEAVLVDCVLQLRKAIADYPMSQSDPFGEAQMLELRDRVGELDGYVQTIKEHRLHQGR